VAEATATTAVVEGMVDAAAGMEAAADMADTDITEGMRRQTEANAPRIFPTGRPIPLKSGDQLEVTIPPPCSSTRAA
jgi:hypothetical protein